MDFGNGTELYKLETAMEVAGVAWWWMELPSGAIFFSPNKARMLGENPDHFLHYEHFTRLVHPDDYEPMMQAMRDHIEGKTEVYQTKYRIRCKDGSYRQFFDKGCIVSRKPGGEISIAGIVLDPTVMPHADELIERLSAAA